MYGEVLGKQKVKPRLNIGVGLFIILIGFFAYRVLFVLSSSTERGGFAYVQLLNFGMPIVETEIYDEGAYAENNLSITTVFMEALGLSNINNFAIVNTELSIYKQGFNEDKTDLKSNTNKNVSLNSFTINENTVMKTEGNSYSLPVSDDLKKTYDPSKVEVLIYHTHTTENYAEAKGDTLDENYSVVGVGDVIAKELEEKYGIAVIHDKTNHSVSYNDSYARSNETVNRYLQKYGDFKMIIDLHRDSVDNKDSVTANINGENVAKLMFVTTRNSTRFAANEALAERMLNRSNTLFPGLTKKIYTYNRGINAFNQSLSDNSILIECGANVNTSAEAQASGKYIARLIAEDLKGR